MWVAPHLTSGLGNRLFQYAAAAGAAEKWGHELVFYIPMTDVSPHGAISSIFRMFPDVRIVEEPATVTEYNEPPRLYYQYMPLGPKPTANIVIKGARQSPKYFPVKVEPDWESALGPSVRKRIEALTGLDPSARHNTYAIHIRLGDYRLLPHHQVDLANYYKRALDKVPEGSRIHVFSDEPNTCIRLFKTIAEERKLILSMAVTQSDVESLYEMTLCLGGTITANSTFSWWGAWFAHAAGAKWATFPSSMGAGMPEPTDFYPEWATVLEVKN